MNQENGVKKLKSPNGITLLALVITIIVLLILAGVSINAIVGENGILNQAQNASKKTNFASEKEAIEFIMSDIKTSQMVDEEIPKEKYIGDKLSEMSSVTGDWKNVIVGENTYKDGWYLIEKGKEITGYGEAKLNWLINYDEGELIELKDGEYTIANANASGAIVDETLKLNIDPVNLQNPDEWGDGVKFVGGNASTESGVKETEIKFDGVDDYLKIEGVTIPKSDGLTFEYYGKHEASPLYLLNKTKFVGNEIENEITSFRCTYNYTQLQCCFGLGNFGTTGNHWIYFDSLEWYKDFDYISFNIDFVKNEIRVFNRGVYNESVSCSESYLKDGDIFKDDIPFTIGTYVGGAAPYTVSFSKFDLYACRLYTRVLSDTEISQNYVATTNYHNELVK